MKGIILKDLYDNFRIGKNLASYIFGGGFIILCALLFSAGVSKQFSFGWLIMMTSTIFSSCTLESAFEQDEKANFNRLLISFPLSKTQIVLSRYLLTLCCIGVANLLTLLLTLYTVFFRHSFSLKMGFALWALGLAISILFSGISIICYYLLGKKNGTIVYMILFFILALIYNIFIVSLQSFGIITINWTFLLIISIPLSIVVFALSFLISNWIFKRRYA